MADDAATYGAAEVCFAADVPRPRFHAWVARQFIAPGPGPGMGIPREFTMAEAVKIAVMAELGRMEVPAGTAAGYATGIPKNCADVQTFMVLMRRQRGIPTREFVQASTFVDLAKKIPRTKGVEILDLTLIATDTTAILQDKMTRHRANIRTSSEWQGPTGETVRLMVRDPSMSRPAPAPKRGRPARKRGRVLEPV